MRKQVVYGLCMILMLSGASGCSSKKEKAESTAETAADVKSPDFSCDSISVEEGQKVNLKDYCKIPDDLSVQVPEIDTSAAGEKTISVTVTDKKGNITMRSVKVTVTPKPTPTPSPTPTPTPEPTPEPAAPQQNNSNYSNNYNYSYNYSNNYSNSSNNNSSGGNSYQAPSQPEVTEPEQPAQPVNPPKKVSGYASFPNNSYGGESGAYNACAAYMNNAGGGACYPSSDGSGYVYLGG